MKPTLWMIFVVISIIGSKPLLAEVRELFSEDYRKVGRWQISHGIYADHSAIKIEVIDTKQFVRIVELDRVSSFDQAQGACQSFSETVNAGAPQLNEKDGPNAGSTPAKDWRLPKVVDAYSLILTRALDESRNPNKFFFNRDHSRIYPFWVNEPNSQENLKGTDKLMVFSDSGWPFDEELMSLTKLISDIESSTSFKAEEPKSTSNASRFLLATNLKDGVKVLCFEGSLFPSSP